jgi:hypothetical protein
MLDKIINYTDFEYMETIPFITPKNNDWKNKEQTSKQERIGCRKKF